MDLHPADQETAYPGPSPATTITELAELLRELQQLLLEYGPIWYTKTMNDRILEKLAAADRTSAALHE